MDPTIRHQITITMTIRNKLTNTPFLVRGIMIVSIFLVIVFQGVTLLITKDSVADSISQHGDQSFLPSVRISYWDEERMLIQTTATNDDHDENISFR